MKLTPRYHWHYGYPLGIALLTEAAWRVEHLGTHRGSDGGLFGHPRRLGYKQRKRLERAGAPHND